MCVLCVDAISIVSFSQRCPFLDGKLISEFECVCEHRHTITVDDVGMMTDFVVLCTCSSLWISLVCSSLRFSFTKTETVRKTAFLFHR